MSKEQIDAALAALRRAVRRAIQDQVGDSRHLDEQIAMLNKARLAELRGNHQEADRLLRQALNGRNGDE
jgi:hypothetical protein